MSLLAAWTPPHVALRDALDAAVVDALLEHAEAREADFTPTGLRSPEGDRGVVLAVRRSAQLLDLAPFERHFRALVYDRARELMARLGMAPVEPSGFETSLVAHGDGDFYRRHIDTVTADDRTNVRVLSGVYYFHRTPPAFSGGELRLFGVVGDARFIDIEPVHNSLLLFPSWAPHEVLPVSCPSRRFMDRRFSVNCWVHTRAGVGANA